MRSELKVSTPNIKLTFVIGLFATVLIITLSLLFRFEFGLILLSVAGSILAIGGVMVTSRVIALIHNRQLNRLELEQRQQQVRLATYEADRAYLQSFTLSFHRNERIVTIPDSPIRVIEALPETVHPALPETITDEEMPKLLDVIADEASIIFTGPKRSGKTNCSFHWLAVRGQCVVADPKNENATVNHWPDNCKVIGSISDIDRAITAVISEMHKRRKAGLTNEANITLFFDEVHYLVNEGVNVVETALSIATLGAEFKVFSAFTAHAITAKYLNVSAAALLENFTVVRVSKVGDIYKTFVNQGDGETEVQSPGKYLAPTVPQVWPDLQPSIIALTEGEMIEQAILNGDSNNKICSDIWGSKNSDRIARINAIRRGVMVVQ